jgi:tight adherence protein C
MDLSTMDGAVLVILFVSGAFIILGLGGAIKSLRGQRRLQYLLRSSVAQPVRGLDNRETRAGRRLLVILESLSQLSLPKEGWQTNNIRLKFVQAGFVSEQVRRTYYGGKTILVFICPVIALMIGYIVADFTLTNSLLIAITVAIIGFYAPDVYLRHRINKRAAHMRAALPDMLDLLVICTDSGLGIDQAMARVSTEMAQANELAASEFYLTTLEIRAGGGRAQALRNLSLRTKLADLGSLASMLIQAHQFGTSVGDALRTQSELMRVRRMQRAEEIAAKVPAKMLLPLVLMIFPALMIVILGPAIMRISEQLG